MKKLLVFLVLASALLGTQTGSMIERLASAYDPAPLINTNITATVTATAISDSEIRLNMSATSTDGRPITQFIIYRDGQYLDTVYVKPPSPSGLGIR